MVFEHKGRHASRWATISAIASKIGRSPEALRDVWLRVAFPTGESPSIQPNCNKAGRLRAGNVGSQAVAHMPHVLPLHSELVEGQAKSGCIRLRDANFARDDDGIEPLLHAENAQLFALCIGSPFVMSASGRRAFLR